MHCKKLIVKICTIIIPTYSSILNVLTYLKDNLFDLWYSTNFLYMPSGVPPIKKNKYFNSNLSLSIMGHIYLEQ